MKECPPKKVAAKHQHEHEVFSEPKVSPKKGSFFQILTMSFGPSTKGVPHLECDIWGPKKRSAADVHRADLGAPSGVSVARARWRWHGTFRLRRADRPHRGVTRCEGMAIPLRNPSGKLSVIQMKFFL